MTKDKKNNTQKNIKKDLSLVFIPLGGTGEIGMNLNLYGYGTERKRQWIMVDAGVTFMKDRFLGVDLIMADIDFIARKKENLLGLILTHGHEDHIGAVPHLYPLLKCPIYMTAFTAELVRNKLKEAHLEEVAEVKILPLEARFSLGAFDIELMTLTHSIAEPNGLAIRTPLGNIFHTGDWKIDPSPQIGKHFGKNKLLGFAKEGVEAMVCDSTNVLYEGRSGSEEDVARTLDILIGKAPHRVLITSFASNIARLATVGRAALKHKKHICLLGRGQKRIYKAAQNCGYLKDFPPLLSEKNAATISRNKLLVLCTGSQGERSAALSRLAKNEHSAFKLEEGDQVIFSSKKIPGNEINILNVKNDLVRLGVKIIDECEDGVHVSGHPNQDELKDLYQWVKPNYVIPVHGEPRHLHAQAKLARQVGHKSVCVENGAVVKLLPAPCKPIGEVPYGRLYLDGRLLLNAEDASFCERKKLSHVGLIQVSLAVDRAGRLASSPAITSFGLPEKDGEGAYFDDLIDDALSRTLPENGKITKKRTRIEAEKNIKRAIKRIWGKNPIVNVDFIDV